MISFDISKITEFFPKILPAITVTLAYVSLSLLFGLSFGFVLAAAKLGRNRVLRALAYGYTTVMRCTPSIVLLFLVYYGLPALIEVITGVRVDSGAKMKYVVITLSMFSAATLSEVMRSSYQALDHGQREAALSIGLTGRQAFTHVLLPQIVYTALPSFVNTLLILLKEGALAYTIGLFDLLGKANYVIGEHFGTYVLEAYTVLVAIYWPISLLIDFAAGKLEKSLDYNTKRKRSRIERSSAYVA